MSGSALQESKPVKRRKPLGKDNEVPLIDKYQITLAKKLNDDAVGHKITTVWSTGNSNRTEWLQRQADYLSEWDEFIDNSDVRTGPWESSSNIHLPITLIAVKALHARMYAALMSVQPPFNSKPLDEAATVAQPLVDGVMSYALREWINNFKGAEEIVDKWLWDWVATGSGLLKLRWDRKFARYVDVVEKEITEPVVVKMPDGTTLVQQKKKKVQRDEAVTKIVFEGPVFDRILPEDLLIIGGNGDISEADVIQHRFFMTRSELYSAADQAVFDPEIVNEILEMGNDSETGDQADMLKQNRQTNSGVITLDTPVDHDRFEIIESYMKLDVNDDGLDEDVIVWVHKRSSKVLRATYLHRVYKSGIKPFVKIDFMMRQGQTYGMGVPEIIYPIAREIDAMHNIKVDFGILSTMPFGFYRPSSGINPADIEIEPGKLIPLNDPQGDIYFPQMGNRTMFAAEEEATLLGFIERLISISDINLGVIGRQGAARTATGVATLVSENNSNLDIFIKRMQRGWKQALRGLFQMLQQRMPAEMWIRITGEDGQLYPFRIGREDIQFKYDFDIDANSASSNKAVNREVAQQILNVCSNPLYIQIGIVSPENTYQAAKNWFSSLDIKDFARYITKPTDQEVFLTPEQEFNRLNRGIPVPIHPAANHEGFINYVKMIFANDDMLGLLKPEQAERLADQASQHMQMIEALSQQQAQVNNRQQQQINASQAGPGNPSVGVGSPVSGGGGG